MAFGKTVAGAALAALPLVLGTASAEEEPAPQITMGNGEKNWIVTEGASREGARFIFPEVRIDGDGWLVMHPFENGAPNGRIYVGHTHVESGTNTDVEITVDNEPAEGDMFIVMLHSDVDDDEEFDFVFVNENEVEDKAVFEGSRMIGHAYAAP